MNEPNGNPHSDTADPLLVDLYQLTMLQAYFDRGMTEEAVFEFFVRRLPPNRNFLVAAGLAQVIEYLESLRFSDTDLAYLEGLNLFTPRFLHYLQSLRFDGDVDAMPEGTVFFQDEPILQVTASMPIAQFIESRVTNLLHFQTLIATKAARCMLASDDKLLVDFGMRRAHGAEAALMAARASYIAGFAGTSNVLAGQRFEIPVFGTMAHSFVEAHDTEMDAFRHFARSHRGTVVLLIDTYDTEAGARHIVDLNRELGPRSIHSVRLDSGDLDSLSKSVRAILDDGDCADIGIFASGGLDEYRLLALNASGAPIDGFGIGTSLDASTDCPSLDCAYKLEEYAGRARRKRSPGKSTWPGRKQVYRHFDAQGRLEHDDLALLTDEPSGEALLQPVLRDGRRTSALPDVRAIRERSMQELERLNDAQRSLDAKSEYPVLVTAQLRKLADRVDDQFH